MSEGEEKILAALDTLAIQGVALIAGQKQKNTALWAAVVSAFATIVVALAIGATVYVVQDKRLDDTVIKLETDRVASEHKFCDMFGLFVPRPSDPPAETDFGKRVRDEATNLYVNKLECESK